MHEQRALRDGQERPLDTTTPTASSRTGTSRLRSTISSFVAPVVLVLLAFVSVFVQVPQNHALSPIDEWVYVDYLAKVPTQGVVTQGEPTGDEAREAIACRGVDFVLPADQKLCDQVEAGTDEGSSFPMKGITSADIYTPLYFWATYAMAQVLHVVGIEDLVVAGSATGAIWLALGMVFLWLGLRRFGIRAPMIIGAGVLFIATPVAFWTYTFISTDAPSFAVGAAMLWLFARITQGASGRIGFVAVAVVGVLLKVQNILAVGAVALALAAWAISEAWQHRDRAVRGLRWLWGGLLSAPVVTAVAAVVLGVVAQGAWLVIRGVIATGSSPDQAVGRKITASNVASEAFKFLFSTASDPTNLLPGVWWIVGGSVASLLAMGGVIAVIASGRKGTPETWLARAVLVMSLIGGPLLAVGVVLQAGYYFELPKRYGLSLMPLYLAAIAIAFRARPWLSWVVLAVAAVTYLGVLTY